jgi:predicted nucleic acid-binding protein
MNGNALKFLRTIEKHRIVGLDTGPLIYLIEDIAPYAALLEPAFELLGGQRMHAVTSTITLAEILTKPLAEKKYRLVDEIKFTLKSFSTLTLFAIDEKLAEVAALVRARHGIRLPDALQVAAAIQGEATLFITNDKRLKKIDAFEVLIPADFL